MSTIFFIWSICIYQYKNHSIYSTPFYLHRFQGYQLIFLHSYHCIITLQSTFKTWEWAAHISYNSQERGTYLKQHMMPTYVMYIKYKQVASNFIISFYIYIHAYIYLSIFRDWFNSATATYYWLEILIYYMSI